MTKLGKMIRPAALLAALALAAAAAAACGDDDGGVTPAPTVTATASATAAATPPGTPESTATPRPSPATTPTERPTAAARRTGNAGVDAVLAAIEARDAAKLTTLAQILDVGCTTRQGLGGPPKCAAGQPEGTVVRVFPIAGCEGSYAQPGQLGALFNQTVTGQNPQVYAVTSAKGSSSEPYFPLGSFSVFVENKGAGTNGVLLSVSESGKVVNLWTGCGGNVSEMYDSRKGDQILLPPLQRGG